MPISMYHASVPVFLQLLGGLKGVIEKAEAHATAHKWEENALLNWRLYPDMFTFARQVRQASEHAFGAGRAAGVAVPELPAIDNSFAEMKARIDKTIDFLKGLKADQLDGREDAQVTPPKAVSRAISVPRTISTTSQCRISISTRRRHTTSCAVSASRSASGTSWARCPRLTRVGLPLPGCTRLRGEGRGVRAAVWKNADATKVTSPRFPYRLVLPLRR